MKILYSYQHFHDSHWLHQFPYIGFDQNHCSFPNLDYGSEQALAHYPLDLCLVLYLRNGPLMDLDRGHAHILFPYLYHGLEMKYVLWTYHCTDPSACPYYDPYPFHDLDLYPSHYDETTPDQSLTSHLWL